MIQDHTTSNSADSYFNSKRWRHWRNESNTTCPAYGCIALTPWTESQAATGSHPIHVTDGKDIVFRGTRPTSYSVKLGTAVCLAANSPQPVKPGAVGLMTQHWPVRMLDYGPVGAAIAQHARVGYLAAPLADSWNLANQNPAAFEYGSCFRTLGNLSLGEDIFTPPFLKVSLVTPHSAEHFASFGITKGPFLTTGNYMSLILNDDATCQLVADPRIATWPVGGTPKLRCHGRVVGGLSADFWWDAQATGSNPIRMTEDLHMLAGTVDPSAPSLGRAVGSFPSDSETSWAGRLHLACGFTGLPYPATEISRPFDLNVTSTLAGLWCRVHLWGMLTRPVEFGDVDDHLELWP